ncbi:hypothetical protein V3C99_003057 [Haemonchus contortus]
MAVEARSRIAPTGLRRTLPNRSLASVPVSRASSSSMLKSEMITSPYPLQGRDVVLDLESRKRYEELRIDIRKLGGRIVDTINEEKLPFVVISDHPTANRLETMKGIYSKNTRIGDLPMLLKEAVRCHVKVRSYTTFQEQFTRFKARIRAAKSLSNAPQKRLPKVEEASKNRKIRRLGDHLSNGRIVKGTTLHHTRNVQRLDGPLSTLVQLLEIVSSAVLQLNNLKRENNEKMRLSWMKILTRLVHPAEKEVLSRASPSR